MIVYAEDFFDEYKDTCYPFTSEDNLTTITGKTIPSTLIKDCNVYSYHPGPIYLDYIRVTSSIIALSFRNDTINGILTASVNPQEKDYGVIYDNSGRTSGFIYFDINALNEIKSWPFGQYFLFESTVSLVPSCFRTLISNKVGRLNTANVDKPTPSLCLCGGPGIILQQETNNGRSVITVNIPGEEVNATTHAPITHSENINFSRQRYVQPQLLNQLRVVAENNEIVLNPNIKDPASRVQLYHKISNMGGNRLRINSSAKSITISLVGSSEESA